MLPHPQNVLIFFTLAGPVTNLKQPKTSSLPFMDIILRSPGFYFIPLKIKSV